MLQKQMPRVCASGWQRGKSKAGSVFEIKIPPLHSLALWNVESELELNQNYCAKQQQKMELELVHNALLCSVDIQHNIRSIINGVFIIDTCMHIVSVRRCLSAMVVRTTLYTACDTNFVPMSHLVSYQPSNSVPISYHISHQQTKMRTFCVPNLKVCSKCVAAHRETAACAAETVLQS